MRLQLTPVLALLLVHDLLLSKGGIALPKTHGLRLSIEKHKGRLTSELTRARLKRKAASMDLLKEEVERESAGEEANYPRWVRVNALKSNVQDQLETTFSAYERVHNIQEVITQRGRHIFIDPHVPNLLAITSGIDLSKTEAYASGKIILQDKASCFPAYLLDPHSEHGDVVDACAAPGNKTTHLAAIIHEHLPEFQTRPQTIYAFEKDSRRAGILTKMVKIAGSNTTTKIGYGQDFLQVDPMAEQYQHVGALLLDPSCSGSGIVGRDSMPELHLPEAGKKSQVSSNKKRKREDKETKPEEVMIDDDGVETVVKSEKDLAARLAALSGFQLTLLLHAFKFPAAKRVTYSTCSIHGEENEHVVIKALASDIAKKRGWRIMKKEEQVRGMQDWPVRGTLEDSNGDATVAEGCIRSYKDDGRGVMGFFVAGFVRDGDEEEVSDDGPYMRDEEGRIVRDATGMPMLKNGEMVELVPREEKEEEEHVEESESEDDSGEDDSGESDDSWEGIGD